MKDFEKLGVFYLGKVVDAKNGKATDDLLLYDSKDLTTHALCVGMTGSGKTGLGISILEEAGIDKVPAIVIDPKGDLSNLLLTFPDLSPEEFKPWIDQAEAERKGMDTQAYAKEIASKWKKGLAEWDEDAERIKSFRNSVKLDIYTPASQAGIPISILNSFAAPSKEEALDSTQLRDKIQALTSSLLGLLGITADPIRSREHILLSTIINQAWKKGQDLNLDILIQQVQKPPFTKIGALDVDTFYPQKDRMDLSISLNNLLASPGFQAWMEGEPLDIKRLLYTKEGKPRIAVISIAHLSDSERMFFVTLLLNEFISWMRRQEGTSSLRALLYMDEIFGFFPPTAMPPSKLPMLTLLKQARAFGIGVVLVTQNPVDLDYKGLSNCGTWFIGKLQTERDKARVIEGLKVASNGEVDAKTLDKMIALTGNRIFMMRSIYEKDPILFQTRWTLSYLRGPLTLPQIAGLTENRPSEEELQPEPEEKRQKGAKASVKPMVPSGVDEYFWHGKGGNSPVHYKPRVFACGRLHFVDAKNKIDLWEDICFALPAEDNGKSVDWSQGVNLVDEKPHLEGSPVPDSTFEELPAGLMQEKTYTALKKAFADTLYQTQTLSLFQATEMGMNSKQGETEGDFRIRLAQAIREKRDEIMKKLRSKYADKIATLTAKIQRAQEKVADKQQESGMKKMDTLISIGTTLLGVFLGRGVTKGTITQTGTTLRRAGQIGKESRQATHAEEDLKNLQSQLDDIETEMNNELAAVSGGNAENMAIDTISIHPRKSDVSVEKIALVWWAQDA